MDLLNDIEEDIKRARLERLWKRLMPYILGASLLTVLGTAGAVAWRHHRTAQAETETAQLLDAGKLPQLAASNARLSGVANLALGQQAVQAGKREDAAVFYRKAFAQTQDAGIRQLAALLLDAASGKAAAPAPAAGQPFYFSRAELLAWQTGDKTQLAALRDDATAPPSLKARLTGALPKETPHE